MGASDAINALRSAAVAHTALSNVVQEGISGAAQAAQKQSSSIRALRSSAEGAMVSEVRANEAVQEAYLGKAAA